MRGTTRAWSFVISATMTKAVIGACTTPAQYATMPSTTKACAGAPGSSAEIFSPDEVPAPTANDGAKMPPGNPADRRQRRREKLEHSKRQRRHVRLPGPRREPESIPFRTQLLPKATRRRRRQDRTRRRKARGALSPTPRPASAALGRRGSTSGPTRLREATQNAEQRQGHPTLSTGQGRMGGPGNTESP